MSERKYTYEQIVKALECCQYRECQECIRLHTGRPIEDDCRLDLIYDSLALIKRQKADVDKLQEVNADLNESLRLAAEANKDLKAEIERLKAEQMMAEGYADALEERAKAEAIKEFAEKLKQWQYESSDWSHGEHPYVVEVVDIDNLVAEMTEGE